MDAGGQSIEILPDVILIEKAKALSRKNIKARKRPKGTIIRIAVHLLSNSRFTPLPGFAGDVHADQPGQDHHEIDLVDEGVENGQRFGFLGQGRVIQELNLAIFSAFREKTISIPFPQWGIYMHHLSTNEIEPSGGWENKWALNHH